MKYEFLFFIIHHSYFIFAMTAFILVGATATGKTAVCQHIAERTGAAIISCDAMLVYKGMDIGTAKPTRDEQRRVRYLGIDLFTPAETSNAALWLAGVKRQLAELPADTPLIVTGGTGLYLRALLTPFNAPPPSPESRARWQNLFDTDGLPALQNALRERLAPDIFNAIPDPKNPRRLMRLLERLDAGEDITPKPRPPLPPILTLTMPRELLHQRIADRVRAMIADGLIDEVRTLRKEYPVWSQTALGAIGYLDTLAYLNMNADETVERVLALYRQHDISFSKRLIRQIHAETEHLNLITAIQGITTSTRQYAKRQIAWFKHQIHPVWLETHPNEPLPQLADRVTAAWQQIGPTPIAVEK